MVEAFPEQVKTTDGNVLRAPRCVRIWKALDGLCVVEMATSTVST
ncbi:MAG TPA: hypothetical protein VN621_00490 [Arthrobacter sp.]|nr:hypothetical protein [Arthrobacter sp.]